MSEFLLPRRPIRHREPEGAPRRRFPPPRVFDETPTSLGYAWQISTTSDRLHVRQMLDGRFTGDGRSFRFTVEDLPLLERALDEAPRATAMRRCGSVSLPWGGRIDVGVGPGGTILLGILKPDGEKTKCHVRLTGSQLVALKAAIQDLRGNAAQKGNDE